MKGSGHNKLTKELLNGIYSNTLNPEMLVELIEDGADITAKGYYNDTPLLIAIKVSGFGFKLHVPS
jgi:ankyrin repeat protein